MEPMIFASPRRERSAGVSVLRTRDALLLSSRCPMSLDDVWTRSTFKYLIVEWWKIAGYWQCLAQSSNSELVNHWANHMVRWLVHVVTLSVTRCERSCVVSENAGVSSCKGRVWICCTQHSEGNLGSSRWVGTGERLAPNICIHRIIYNHIHISICVLIALIFIYTWMIKVYQSISMYILQWNMPHILHS